MVEKGELNGCFVLWGEESYLQNYYLKKAMELYKNNLAEFNLHDINAKDMTPGSLTDAVESYPMMSESKMVIVRNMTQEVVSSLNIEKVVSDVVKNLPEYTVLVFSYDQSCDDPSKSRLLKKIFSSGYVSICRFDKASERSLMSWIMRHFKSHGKRISDKNIEYLMSRCGSSMVYLSGEIEKVALYAKGDEVQRKDIDAVTIQTVESRVYDMINAVLSDNSQKAFHLLKDLYEQGTEPVVINAALSKQISDLLLIKLCLKRTKSSQDIAKTLSMPAWLVRKNMELVKNHGTHELKMAISACAQADMDIKSSKVDPETVIEILVGKLIGNPKEQR